jgi:hypothetical protein
MPPGALASPEGGAALRQTAGLVQVELPVAHVSDERAPFIWRIPVDRTPAMILGVPHQDHALVIGHFDAAAAIGPAEGALPPAVAV